MGFGVKHTLVSCCSCEEVGYVPPVPEADAGSTQGQEEQLDQPEDKKPATPPTEKTRQEIGEATDSHCGDTTNR